MFCNRECTLVKKEKIIGIFKIDRLKKKKNVTTTINPICS